MATIQVQASREELLQAIQQLDKTEFAGLVTEILSLRAQRAAPILSADETALLQRVNQHLTDADQRRRAQLLENLAAETLTAEEHTELIRLNDEAERLNAQRLEALVQMAALRQVSLRQVMQDSGLEPETHA